MHHAGPNGAGVIPYYGAFTDFTPTIPKMYWDVYDQEQRLKGIGYSLHKLACYGDALNDEIAGYEESINGDFDEYKETLNGKQTAFENKITQQQSEYEEQITQQQSEYEEQITNQQTQYESQITNQQTQYESQITNQQTQYESQITNQQNTYQQGQDKKFNDLKSSVEATAQEALDTAEAALSRTMNNGYVNVVEYGADNTGATACDEAIAKAVKAMSTTLTTLYFPAGTYKVTKAITLPNGLQGMFGELSTIVTGTTMTEVVNISAAYTPSIQGFIFKCDSHADCVIKETSAQAFRINDCVFLGDYGIGVDATPQNYLIMDGCTFRSTTPANNNTGLKIDKNSSVFNTVFESIRVCIEVNDPDDAEEYYPQLNVSNIRVYEPTSYEGDTYFIKGQSNHVNVVGTNLELIRVSRAFYKQGGFLSNVIYRMNANTSTQDTAEFFTWDDEQPNQNFNSQTPLTVVASNLIGFSTDTKRMHFCKNKNIKVDLIGCFFNLIFWTLGEPIYQIQNIEGRPCNKHHSSMVANKWYRIFSIPAMYQFSDNANTQVLRIAFDLVNGSGNRGTRFNIFANNKTSPVTVTTEVAKDCRSSLKTSSVSIGYIGTLGADCGIYIKTTATALPYLEVMNPSVIELSPSVAFELTETDLQDEAITQLN